MAKTRVYKGTTLPDSTSKDDIYAMLDNAVVSVSEIVNADFSATAIVDTKLSTISTHGKVETKALAATSFANGDMLYWDGSSFVKLAIGTAGQKLKMSGTSMAKLICCFDGADGATAYAAETNQEITFKGTAQLDTAQKYSGSASLYLPTTGMASYCTVPDSANWAFGTSPFTIDGCFRFATLPLSTNAASLLGQATNSAEGNYWELSLYNQDDTTYTLQFVSSGTSFNASLTASTATWYHLMVGRTGTSFKVACNGIQLSTTVSLSASALDIANTLDIGRCRSGLISTIGNMNGWIDNLRITKGVCLWDTDFTAPAGVGITLGTLIWE